MDLLWLSEIIDADKLRPITMNSVGLFSPLIMEFFRFRGPEDGGRRRGVGRPLARRQFAQLAPGQEQRRVPDVQDLPAVSGLAAQDRHQQAQIRQNGSFTFMLKFPKVVFFWANVFLQKSV